ncbi:Fc.00g056590.m01.CDS01 [Cosmosporella sp. VM-42]
MNLMSPGSNTESPEAEGTTRKRRRTALACDECRERKRKCDGIKPKCGACTARSAPCCIWNQERTSNGRWSNSYVDGLRNRIRELEKKQGIASNSIENSSSVNLSALHPDEAAPPPQPVSPPAAAIHSPNLSKCCGDASTDEWLSNFDHLMPDHDSITVALDPSASFEPLMITPTSVDGLGRNEGHGSPESQETEAELDGMGIISSIDSVTSTRTRRSSNYFGPSSTISLLGKARSAMGRRCCGHGPLLENSFGPCTTCENRALSMESQLQTVPKRDREFQSRYPGFGMSLPLRSEADRLVESYWTGMHTLYPFLHWPSFHQRYSSIWNPREHSDLAQSTNTFYDRISEELFYCLLNVVFALGVHFSTHIDQRYREDVSYSFFKRAKTFLNLDLLADGSIALVQTLLLMGQYLQTRNISSSCWNIVGLAIRVAQGIGLHFDLESAKGEYSSNKTLNRLEVEMYRRSWAGCVLLDRILSLIYGRPLMVHPIMSEKQLILPSAIDDELLTDSPESQDQRSNNSPSLTECYVQAVKLGNILGQFLTAFYYGDTENDPDPYSEFGLGLSVASASSRVKGIKSSSLQMLLDYDDQLTLWNKQLPFHLNVKNYASEGYNLDESAHSRRALFHRQAVVLKAR